MTIVDSALHPKLAFLANADEWHHLQFRLLEITKSIIRWQDLGFTPSVVTRSSVSNDAGLLIWIHKRSQPANIPLVVDPGQHL